MTYNAQLGVGDLLAPCEEMIVMPTYEYKCHTCGKNFEATQPITADPLKVCTLCGGTSVERLISSGGGLIFKGSGFYVTDYRSSSYKKDASKDKPQITKASSPDKKTSPSATKTPASSND